MKLSTFLKHVQERNIKLQVEDGQLHYTASVGSITPEILNELSQRQGEIIDLLLHTNAGDAAIIPDSSHRQPEAAYPLSYQQESIWILEHIYPNSRAYNMIDVIHLAGLINISALSAAIEETVRRHKILRTVYHSVESHPVQTVRQLAAPYLQLIDLSSLADDSDRRQEVDRLIKYVPYDAFDLSTDLMLRMILIRLEGSEHRLLANIHHIAYDGWSRQIFWKELCILYNAYCNDKDSPLPDLNIQYADYALWQRQPYFGDLLQQQMTYWQNQLTNLSQLVLPTDYARPTTPSFHASSCTRLLTEDNLEQLTTLSKQQETTLYMTLLSAYLVFLYRYSGQTDIAIATPVANRQSQQIEGLIGFFVNTLVIRGDLSGNPRFVDFLHQMKEVCISAYENQDLPFDKLIADLQPERYLDRNPLVQVGFSLQNDPSPSLAMKDISPQVIVQYGQRVRLDIECNAERKNNSLILNFTYSTDLYSHETINRMLDNFINLLS
ncbi:MAG: condensation domain-containing protein, partial [Methanosarcinaceae archaeon]|nr:condensation domain-containing protein [Methanosarcinaceae archaeon]